MFGIPGKIVDERVKEHHDYCPNPKIYVGCVDIDRREGNPERKRNDHAPVGRKKQRSSSDVINHECGAHCFEPIGDGIDPVDLVLKEWVGITEEVEDFTV